MALTHPEARYRRKELEMPPILILPPARTARNGDHCSCDDVTRAIADVRSCQKPSFKERARNGGKVPEPVIPLRYDGVTEGRFSTSFMGAGNGSNVGVSGILDLQNAPPPIKFDD